MMHVHLSATLIHSLYLNTKHFIQYFKLICLKPEMVDVFSGLIVNQSKRMTFHCSPSLQSERLHLSMAMLT